MKPIFNSTLKKQQLILQKKAFLLVRSVPEVEHVDHGRVGDVEIAVDAPKRVVVAPPAHLLLPFRVFVFFEILEVVLLTGITEHEINWNKIVRFHVNAEIKASFVVN